MLPFGSLGVRRSAQALGFASTALGFDSRFPRCVRRLRRLSTLARDESGTQYRKESSACLDAVAPLRPVSAANELENTVRAQPTGQVCQDSVLLLLRKHRGRAYVEPDSYLGFHFVCVLSTRTAGSRERLLDLRFGYYDIVRNTQGLRLADPTKQFSEGRSLSVTQNPDPVDS
jgi:hypothetical protein